MPWVVFRLFFGHLSIGGWEVSGFRSRHLGVRASGSRF